MIKSIIFDLDGVLVDATEWHYEALNRALGVFGLEIGRDDHLKVYNGIPTVEKLKSLSSRGLLPTGLHSLISFLKQKYTNEIIATRCRPDYEKILMLKELSKHYGLSVCSNAKKESVVNMLGLSQIKDFFIEIMGNDEGYLPKPNPEMYTALIKKLGLTPNEVLIVEDSPHGIEAAKNSGAKVIAVRSYADVNLDLFDQMGMLSNSGSNVNSDKYKINDIGEFTKGWVIGDFEPALYRTKELEVAIKSYEKDESEPEHMHKVATEYTIALSGSYLFNNTPLAEGQIICIPPNDKVRFKCVNAGKTLVIKVPSAVNDKYITERV